MKIAFLYAMLMALFRVLVAGVHSLAEGAYGVLRSIFGSHQIKLGMHRHYEQRAAFDDLRSSHSRDVMRGKMHSPCSERMGAKAL